MQAKIFHNSKNIIIMKKERIAGLVPAWKIGGMALALLMVLGMASCGGDSNDPNTLKLEVKPELGALGDYITIESKEAVITLSEFTDDGKPYVKIASTLQVTVNKDVASDDGFDLDVVVLDANMNEITDFGYYDIDDATDYDVDTYHHYLKAGDYRAVMDESGSKERWDGKPSAMWEMMRQNGKYMVLKPRWSSAKYVPYSGVASLASTSEVEDADELETEEVAAVSGSEDWDKILDEYESYCNKLVAAAKKAKAGDVSVMAEYASLLESAESLQKKLENASSSLSVAQATRMNKIAATMAKAMM